jgi:hypothetical protein
MITLKDEQPGLTTNISFLWLCQNYVEGPLNPEFIAVDRVLTYRELEFPLLHLVGIYRAHNRFSGYFLV